MVCTGKPEQCHAPIGSSPKDFKRREISGARSPHQRHRAQLIQRLWCALKAIELVQDMLPLREDLAMTARKKPTSYVSWKSISPLLHTETGTETGRAYVGCSKVVPEARKTLDYTHNNRCNPCSVHVHMVAVVSTQGTAVSKQSEGGWVRGCGKDMDTSPKFLHTTLCMEHLES